MVWALTQTMGWVSGFQVKINLHAFVRVCTNLAEPLLAEEEVVQRRAVAVELAVPELAAGHAPGNNEKVTLLDAREKHSSGKFGIRLDHLLQRLLVALEHGSVVVLDPSPAPVGAALGLEPLVDRVAVRLAGALAQVDELRVQHLRNGQEE